MRIQPKPKLESSLRYDWAAEEKRFAENLPAFHESIGISKKIGTEEHIPEELVGKEKKSDKSVQGTDSTPVEFKSVRALQCDVPTLQPPQPEQKVPNDPFDDFLSSPTQKPNNSCDDLFDVQVKQIAFPPPEQPAESPVVQTAAPKDAVPSNAIPPNNVDNLIGELGISGDDAEGLNVERFGRIKRACDQMMDNIPRLDIDSLLANDMSDYSVDLAYDHLREDPKTSTDKLVAVQAKRDALSPWYSKLAQVASQMRRAEDYLIKAGIACSSRSSRELREAHIRSMLPDFWVRLAKLEGLEERVKRTMDNLESQYECISRVITSWQIRSKMNDIARPELPWEEPKSSPIASPPNNYTPRPATIQRPEPVFAAPTGAIDDDTVNRRMSEPLAVKKSTNMESFDPASRPAARQSRHAKGEVDF